MKILRSVLALVALAFLAVSPALAADKVQYINGIPHLMRDNGDGSYSELVTVQGFSSGTPQRIAGADGAAVTSSSNPFPSVLYSSAGTAVGVTNSSTDQGTATSTNDRLKVRAIIDLYNGTGTSTGMSRAYQIDATTSAGTGVMAVGIAGTAFSNITTATTTTVKSGAGIVQSIVVNTPAAGTITGYCNTAASGTKFATVTTIASTQPFTITYNTYCTTGITIVTSAVMDITVNYR